MLKLAGTQLVSTSCSAGRAGRASCLSLNCPHSIWLPLTTVAAAAAAPLLPGPGPGLESLPDPGAPPGLATALEVVLEGVQEQGRAGEGELWFGVGAVYRQWLCPGAGQWRSWGRGPTPDPEADPGPPEKSVPSTDRSQMRRGRRTKTQN